MNFRPPPQRFPATINYERVIHSDTNNSSNSNHQEFSFTYVKPDLMNTGGLSYTTKNSRPNDVMYTRWDPKKTGPEIGKR